jgi:hypothetical protein
MRQKSNDKKDHVGDYENKGGERVRSSYPSMLRQNLYGVGAGRASCPVTDTRLRGRLGRNRLNAT